MSSGGGFPGEFASALCIQNAALTQNEKTLVLASLSNTQSFQSVSAQMRRLFGPCGYESRQDFLVAADMDSVCEGEDFEAWIACRKAKRAEKAAQGSGERGSRETNRGVEIGNLLGNRETNRGVARRRRLSQGSREPSWDGRARNSINRRAAQSNRCFTRNSEYHFAPPCPQKEARYGGAPSPYRQRKKPPSKPYSSIAMQTPVEVGSPKKLAPVGPARSHENSFSTSLELGGQFAATQSDSVVALDTGATANLACRKWLVANGYWSDNRNLFLERKALPRQRPPSLGMAKLAR